MSNISIDVDCAKAILRTYQQVGDSRPLSQPRLQRNPLVQRTQELESEVNQLKEQYKLLQNELSTKDERIARLNRQLDESTFHMNRLQDDFEHAISQLSSRK